MRRVRLILSAIVATYALGTVAAQAALPEYGGTLPSKINTSSTLPLFENEGGTFVLKCANSSGTGELTGAKSWTSTNLYKECKATLLGIPIASCKSLTSTDEESLLIKGTTTLGFALGTLEVIQALTFSEIHLECGSVLASIRGCVLAFATPLTLGTIHTLSFKGAKGVQELTDYTTDTGTMTDCKAEIAVNAEAFRPMDLAAQESIVFAKQVEIKD